MLSKLTINNVALIESLELDFCNKLNILSGETGAGKSIIVDSLMLLLGERYDKSLLRYGQNSGFVEGVFDSTEASNEALESLGMASDDNIIVTRRFFLDGKNDIRINGRAASSSMLKQVMVTLVDIYGQNDQSLTKTSEHLRILDYYIRHKTGDIREALEKKCHEYKEVKAELGSLGDLSERERNIDILSFQIDEITKAKVKKDEEDELIVYRNKIAAVEKISETLSSFILVGREQEDSPSALSLIDCSAREMRSITQFSKVYDELYERLNSLSIELDDMLDTAQDELDSLEFDYGEVDKVEKRLEEIRSLKRKYGDYDKMNLYLKKSQEDLYRLEHCSEIYDNLVKRRDGLIDEIYHLSSSLHAIRLDGAKEFSSVIVKELGDLGMTNCSFEVNFSSFPTLAECENYISANGFDKAEFYLSPNIGQPLKPLIKIISGGEMSRFMLALKVISSRTDDIPTMIFDEIDAGISGKIGQEVAKKLARISRFQQVLCVTHLPQIASMADNHYFISKNTDNNETITTVNMLSDSAIIEEISRLSGAKDISSTSCDNARQMKKWCDSFKKSIE